MIYSYPFDTIIEVWILIERHFGCGKKTSIYAVCKNASKHGRESTFYCMDFDELGVVGQLALPDFQRHQNHHQPSNIYTFRSNIVILVIFGRFFSTKKSAFLMHFGDIWYENDQNARKMQNMATKCINIGRTAMILASLESWECQLSNDAKLVKIRPVEGRFVTMF